MAQKDTVERILDAAEQLFSEKGFAETSLRNITTKAGVNLAAVNYHFGSKKALIQAVFARYLQPFSQQLEQDTAEYVKANGSSASKAALDDLLELLLVSMAKSHIKGVKLNLVMRLLGLAYMQGQGHLRKFLSEEYGDSYIIYVKALNEITPGLTEQERFWRVHFALGSVVFSMSSLGALLAIERHEYGKRTDVETVIAQLKSFVSAGIHNPEKAQPIDALKQMDG